ncbi:hypothetical protein BEI_1925 [Halomonas beimenensis]|uniref:Uncharacterized protein n=1 Tax=Halomonas beimenensis TaxID=475662 RepID=A0A291P7S7_9GAMM|nr:hypothetical protein BEI_1925 [Halomonas beimenensis]
MVRPTEANSVRLHRPRKHEIAFSASEDAQMTRVSIRI